MTDNNLFRTMTTICSINLNDSISRLKYGTLIVKLRNLSENELKFIDSTFPRILCYVPKLAIFIAMREYVFFDDCVPVICE